MKIARVVFGACSILFWQFALAADIPKDYDPAETRCLSANEATIDRILERLDYADKSLPNIPSEERSYLEAESATALKTYYEELDSRDDSHLRSNQIYSTLNSRPLYPVWKLRKALELARTAVQKIKVQNPKGSAYVNGEYITYRKNLEAERLERAAHAVYLLGDYVNETQKFLEEVKGRELAYMAKSQYTQYLIDINFMNSDLGNYISCKLAKIMGRQSFLP